MMQHPPLALLSDHERETIASLNTPSKIQAFVMDIPHNFETKGDTCQSVRAVLRSRKAHCIEAALVAAFALWVHGEEPLLLDLTANERDDDHVVAVFKRNGCWGAISKSNHAYLGYRDPVYRTLRELAMSYFHEYFNADGEKTLRAYSSSIDLRRFSPEDWITGGAAWTIAEATCTARHYQLVDAHVRPTPIDPLTRRTMAIRAWDPPAVSE